jgi:hypothetical protein
MEAEQMVEKSTFMDFDALKIINQKGDELVVLTEVGPRIISFRPENGDNIFYVNEKDFSWKEKGSKTWHVYGGTRLWTSPETELTYSPDNSKSETHIEDERVLIQGPVDPNTKLRKTIDIRALPSTFHITFAVKNEGRHLFSAGLWALTCVRPQDGSEIFLPWGEISEWNVKDMKYWRSWLGSRTAVGSEQWRPTDEFFVVRPNGQTGKVGFANRWGFALYRAGDVSFIKYADYIESAFYPDGGCSFEVYTSKEFYEIETLSPLFMMKPGSTYTHSEVWWAGFDAVDVGSIDSAHHWVETTIGEA